VCVRTEIGATLASALLFPRSIKHRGPLVGQPVLRRAPVDLAAHHHVLSCGVRDAGGLPVGA
jgi:hypothetical protein